jgi:photosystem II stability/assembly factor-like uncharacterized protein
VSTRAPALALSVVLVSAGGCWCGGWVDGSESIELGVDVDLQAVTGLSDSLDPYWRSYFEGLAVGSSGTVVAWGWDHDAEARFVERFTVGEADLRAAWAAPSAWWVVGDDGLVAVSGDLGQTWTTVVLGTDADLRAITSVGSRMVVVGDDVVRTQSIDGSWSEPAHDGEWGQLRALHREGGRLWAVGLEGVIWSTADPSEAWMREPSGVETDLFDVGHHYDGVIAVGAAGTLLLREAGVWTRVKTREQVDLIAYEREAVLAANGELFEITGKRHELSSIDSFPGARALGGEGGVLVVGDDGLAIFKDHVLCGY